MLNATRDFIEAMTASVAEVKVKIELLDKDDHVIDIITTDVASNDIGDISVDVERDIRRQFTLTLNNHSGRFVWNEGNLIWINLKKVKLYIGFDTPNGTEFVPQGVFILTSPESSSYPSETKTVIAGQDQWYLLSGNFGRYTSEVTYDAYEKDENGDFIVDENGQSKLKTEKDESGNTITDSDGNPVYYRITNYIKSILQNAGITKMIIDDCDKYLVSDLTYEIGSNRGDAIKDMVEKCYSDTDDYFYEAFFDVNGYFRFQKVMKPEKIAPSWTYKIETDTMYAGSTRRLVDEELFNHILVLGGTNDTAEFRTEIVVDETAYENTKYGDASRSEFNKGTHNNTESDLIGRLKLLETKEDKTLSDGSKVKVGIGEFQTSGNFISRWFGIGSDYNYKDSTIDWLEVVTNKDKVAATETSPEIPAIKQTLVVTVEFSDTEGDNKTVIGSGTVKSGSPLPYLTIGNKLPKYMRYKVAMTTSDNSLTPVLTNLQFSITVDNLLWKEHPYSIQNIGDRMYFWNDGIDGNIDTQSQCNARAKYELNQNLAYTEQVELSLLPNYLHEGNDVICIEDANNGCRDNYQIKSFSIPIRPEMMSCTVKKIRQVT